MSSLISVNSVVVFSLSSDSDHKSVDSGVILVFFVSEGGAR